MKRLPTLILSFLAIILCTTTQAQIYKWVRGGGTNQNLVSSINQEAVYSLCTDPNGNIYALSTVGINAVTADTFYSPGGIGSSQSILFTSHNCNGQMRFAKLITGTGNYPNGVEADNMGHIYIAFDCSHSATNPLRIRYDTTIAAFTNCRDAIVQYDTSGHLNWLRFVGADAFSTYSGTGGWSNYLTMDGFGNPHFVVYAKRGVTLSPTFTTTRRGFYDHAYDASGNLLSIKTIDVDSTLLVNGVNIDKQSSKMYVQGARNVYDFPDSSAFVYIAGLDNDRNKIWIDTLANPVAMGKGFRDIVTDGFGHIYVTMGGSGKIVYRGDTAKNTISTIPNAISVVMKADTAGNALWMRTFSANIAVNGLPGLTLFGANKVAATGVMAGVIACTSDTLNIYSGEGQNAFFTILDTAGYVHELKQLHGIGFYDAGGHVAAGKAGNLYIGGKLESNIWGGSLPPYTSVGGDSDYFIMKYGVDCGCTSMPVANYTYSGSDFTKNFTYTGTASIDSVRWSFGDGGTSTIFNPAHTYTMAGSYTVCVRIYSPCGNDMKCYEVNVSCAALPVASYIDTGNMVRGFTYTGTTTAYYDSLRWSFGDGSFDTGLNVIHTYPAAGTYTVCAIIYTHCGNDTACTTITTTSTSVATLQAQPDNISIYPNPTTNTLNILGITKPTEYRLLSAVGSPMIGGLLSNGLNSISLSPLPSGLYILELQTATDRKQIRVIKQ